MTAPDACHSLLAERCSADLRSVSDAGAWLLGSAGNVDDEDDAKIAVWEDVGDFLHLPEPGGRESTSQPRGRWLEPAFFFCQEPPQSLDELVRSHSSNTENTTDVCY